MLWFHSAVDIQKLRRDTAPYLAPGAHVYHRKQWRAHHCARVGCLSRFCISELLALPCPAFLPRLPYPRHVVRPVGGKKNIGVYSPLLTSADGSLQLQAARQHSARALVLDSKMTRIIQTGCLGLVTDRRTGKRQAHGSAWLWHITKLTLTACVINSHLSPPRTHKSVMSFPIERLYPTSFQRSCHLLLPETGFSGPCTSTVRVLRHKAQSRSNFFTSVFWATLAGRLQWSAERILQFQCCLHRAVRLAPTRVAMHANWHVSAVTRYATRNWQRLLRVATTQPRAHRRAPLETMVVLK